MNTQLPRIDLQGFESLRFTYDNEFDVAHLRLNTPCSSVAEEVADGWYLFDDDSSDYPVATSLEIHNFLAEVAKEPYFAGVVKPCFDEVERFTGMQLKDGVVAEGSTGELPLTARLVTFLLGVAITKLEASREDERIPAK